MFRFALMIVAVAFLSTAGKADDSDKKELEKFQGTWTAVSYVRDGASLEADDLAKIQLTVKGDESQILKGKRLSKGTYKVNPAKTPKELDIVITEGADEGKKLLAIYEFKDDTLRICLALPGKPRPKEFVSKADSGVILETWKKKK